MSDSASQAVESAFERYSRGMLQLAVNFVEGVPGVDRIWIYTIMDSSSIEVTPYYRYKGHFYQFSELANELGEDEFDVEGFSDESEEYDLPFLRAMRESGAAIPERIIISYDPEAGTMESSWDYEGTKEDPDDPGWQARDEWVKSMGGKPMLARNREPSE